MGSRCPKQVPSRRVCPGATVSIHLTFKITEAPYVWYFSVETHRYALGIRDGSGKRDACSRHPQQPVRCRCFVLQQLCRALNYQPEQFWARGDFSHCNVKWAPGARNKFPAVGFVPEPRPEHALLVEPGD